MICPTGYFLPLLLDALRSIGVEGEIDPILQTPHRSSHGDLTTNVALRLSAVLARPADQIARQIVEVLRADPHHALVDTGGDGYINVRFTPLYYQSCLARILEHGRSFGHYIPPYPRTLRLEQRPSGLGTRGRFLGEIIEAILCWGGYDVVCGDPGNCGAAGADHLDPVVSLIPLSLKGSISPETTGEFRRLSYSDAIIVIEGGAAESTSSIPTALIEELGEDLLRFYSAMQPMDTPLRIDLDSARRQHTSNPYYRVRSTIARIAGIERFARTSGITPSHDTSLTSLTGELEITVIRELVRLPEALTRAAAELEPRRVVGYLHDLIDASDRFYRECRIIAAESHLRDARLALLAGTRIGLCNALQAIGIPATIDRDAHPSSIH